MRREKQKLLCLALLLLATCCATADTIWDYEAVNSIGFGIHPKVNADASNPANKVTVEGVVIGGSHEILNPGPPAAMGIQYTLFIQDDTSDRGGIQVWAGSWFYGDPMWTDLRQTDYIDVQPGDRVRVTGFLADAGRGKVVINHRHSNNPDLVFHVEILGHPGMPDPVLIKSVSECNYFDETRSGGGELYQTRWVMLHGVSVGSGAWTNNSLLTVSDRTGSVGLLLSAMGDFTGNPKPEFPISVVGIFDQEDTTAPYTEGYRIWVKKQADVARALDFCREVRTCALGEMSSLKDKVVSRVFPGFFYVQDETRTGGVRVESSRAVAPGNRVCIHGSVCSIGNEKALNPRYLIVQESDEAPKPIGVTSRELWCSSGLDVYGLLVRCVCTVKEKQEGGVYLLVDDAGKTIKAQTYGFELPSEGTRVAINAVASQSEGAPLLLIASTSDVEVIQ
ncbi:MAG: hypothetical protein QHI38_08725 [Armatimonadota bacterium]|nr:hypothetical protein [Armatimonadota bacterium]